MKKLFLFMSSLLLLLICCEDINDTVGDSQYESDGIITGVDMRECACCGGWFIDILDSTYRFYEIPGNSSLKLNEETFPLAVNLDWRRADPQCLGDEIIVERISKK